MDMETSLALQSLRGRVTDLESRWKSPTTAETTKTAPTQANPSDVAPEYMTLITLSSSQSDQADTPSGPVESCSGCAHLWVINVQMAESTWKHHLGNLRCIHGCGAMRSFDLTPALAAVIT